MLGSSAWGATGGGGGGSMPKGRGHPSYKLRQRNHPEGGRRGVVWRHVDGLAKAATEGVGDE